MQPKPPVVPSRSAPTSSSFSVLTWRHTQVISHDITHRRPRPLDRRSSYQVARDSSVQKGVDEVIQHAGAVGWLGSLAENCCWIRSRLEFARTQRTSRCFGTIPDGLYPRY